MNHIIGEEHDILCLASLNLVDVVDDLLLGSGLWIEPNDPNP